MSSNFLSFFHERFRGEETDSKSRKRARANALLKPRRLATEALEDRRLLSASAEYVDAMNAYLAFGGEFSESNFNAIEIRSTDLSAESLNAAIARAAATPENDVIFVVGGGTLTFAPTDKAFEIDVDSETRGFVGIVGYGGKLTIDANDVDRAFVVKNGSLLLGSVELVDGKADFGGAIAVAEGGDVSLDAVVFNGNEATERGGAVANMGVLRVQNARFVDNVAGEDGAAIYDGEFELDPVEATPEFVGFVKDVSAANGATVAIDLADYFNEGDWSYSFDCSNETAAIFAEAPSLKNGVLTLQFIGNADYVESLDLSSATFSVSAASKTDPTAVATSNEFRVGLAAAKTVAIQAAISNVANEDVRTTYAVKDGRKTAGFGADEIPGDQEVDYDEYLYLQLWAQDFAKNWGVETDCLGSFMVVVRVVNGEFYNEGDYDVADLGATTIISDLGAGIADLDGDGVAESYRDYKVSAMYMKGSSYDGGKKRIGVDNAILFGSIAFDQIDKSQTTSVYLCASPNPADQLVNRRRAAAAGEVVVGVGVNPSQIELIGDFGGGTAAASNFSASVPLATLSSNGDAIATAPTTIVSNAIFVGNRASGNGVVYAAEGRVVDATHATFANNVAECAALCVAGADADDSALANSIVVFNVDSAGNALAPTDAALVVYSLGDAFEKASLVDRFGNVAFDASRPLFANDGFELAKGSQAIDVGSADLSLDVGRDPLKVDISGAPRGDVPDAGAYEYQVAAPAAPTDVVFGKYDAVKQTLEMRWTDNAENETGFVVEYKVGETAWRVAQNLGRDATSRIATLVRPGYEYQFRVKAVNAEGASGYATASFDVGRDVLTTVAFSTDCPAVGEEISAALETERQEGTFQWFRVDATGNETLLVGATGATYIPTAADLGARLKVVATSANGAFSSSAASVGEYVVVETSRFAPAAPSNVWFSNYDVVKQTLEMYWTDNSKNETSFEVQYRKDGGVRAGEWLAAATLPANAIDRVCGVVRPEYGYDFRIRAVKTFVDSAGRTQNLYSDWAEASFDYKTDFLVDASLSTDAPKVGEAISVVGAEGLDVAYRWIRVEGRSDDALWPWSAGYAICQEGPDATYVPTDADAGCAIFVVVSTNNPAYEIVAFDWTENVVAETTTSRPVAPSDVRLSDYDPETQTLKTTWTNGSASATQVVVEYKQGDGAWKKAASFQAGSPSELATERVATKVYDGANFSFRLKSINAVGESVYTEVSFNSARDVLESVSIGGSAAVGDSVQATLGSAANEATFQWRRVDADGNATEIEGATGSVYEPTSADVGFRLQVVATGASKSYFSQVSSALSAIVVAAPTVPNAPSNVAFGVYDAAKKSVAMTWRDNSENETGFVVEYSVDGGRLWSSAATLDANATERVGWGLKAGATYSFRVAAFNKGGRSDWAVAEFQVPAPIANAATFADAFADFGEEDADEDDLSIEFYTIDR